MHFIQADVICKLKQKHWAYVGRIRKLNIDVLLYYELESRWLIFKDFIGSFDGFSP